MSKVLRFYLLIIIISFAYVLGGFYGRGFVLSAIEHNMTINIVISTVFIGSLIFSLYASNQIYTQYRHWQSFDKEGGVDDSLTLERVFGKKFSAMISAEENKRYELLQAWTEHTDWKARILDYLSGTLIGLGLLGTFIGLMHTMGSISDVLGAASGDDMVKAIAVPLSSMSSAFSASLMGLLSSLSVGLLGILVDRLNSEFVENIKSWIYNRAVQKDYTRVPVLFDDLQIDRTETLSQSSIQRSLAKIDAFCYQAGAFLSEIDDRIEDFKLEMAHAFDKVTHEVIKINAVTESVNRHTAIVIENNQQLCREIINGREEVMTLNQLSITLNEKLKNEILLNRKDIFELNKKTELASSKIKEEVLSHRNDLLNLNKLTTTFTQQFERHKDEMTTRMLKVMNNSYDSTNDINEIKDKIDNLDENSRYNKNNIGRILTLQAICHDAGLVSLEELTKIQDLLATAQMDKDKLHSIEIENYDGKAKK